MPIDLSYYPPDWKELSLRLKTAANWQCQDCDRPCRHTGESLDKFFRRILQSHPERTAKQIIKQAKLHPQRFVLTVAHLDQNSFNNEASNLRCLCTICHLNFDRPFFKHNRLRKRERRGQLNLFKPELLFERKPAGQGKDRTRIQLPIPAPV